MKDMFQSIEDYRSSEKRLKFFFEEIKYLEEFKFVVSRIISCNELQILPLLKDRSTAYEEREELLKCLVMKRLKYEWYPEKNVIYLSKHSAIRRLTRVMVMRALENGFVEVFNMDDLTFETAGTREIRKCPISLQSLNPSIITIKLFNIECCKEIFEEPSVVLNRISELLNHKLLCAFIRQFDVDLPIVDIYYNNNTTNLFYQQLLDDGLFVRSNEVVVEQLSDIPTEIENYNIIEQHEQEFVCIFKCLKNDTIHPMIYPLIDNHVDNMRKLETALRNLDLYNLPYITAPFMNKTCIVYSPVSRKHYRAKILSEIFGSGVNVLYIDECTTGTVRLKFIRQIPSVLMLYKTKLLEVSLHNFQFKKEYYEEIQIDLNRLLKDKTMYVLIRSFNDDGIPIVDLCKRSSKVLVLMYQEIIDNFTPTSTIEDLNSDAKSVDEMICFKKKSSISLQSYDEEFICTFAYFVGPYNLAVYQLIDIVNFETEGIEDSLIELKKSGNLKNVTNPEFDTVYYACTPDNTYYLCKIVKFYGNISRMEIQLLKCNKHMFVHLDDLYLVPDMNLGPIEVTLNFRFNAKFDALIERELNKVLINKRINVVIRECEPDSLLVVDIYEIGSSKLIYQDLIDMIIEMEKKEIESIQNITQNGDNLEDNSFGQDLNPKEVNLMKFDDFSVDQSFEKQKIKRLFFQGVDVILKSLGCGVFTCILSEFTTINDFQVLPLINETIDDLEPLEVQVKKFQEKKLSVQLYKVRINKNVNLEEFENRFLIYLGDQSFTAVVRDCDDNGVPQVDLYGSNPFILAYQDFINDGSLVINDEEPE